MIINELKRQKFSLKRRVSECLSNKKMAPSHIIIVFVATAGQNGENLGSDEAQIVSFVYLLYDVSNNKVRRIFFHLILYFFSIHGYLTWLAFLNQQPRAISKHGGMQDSYYSYIGACKLFRNAQQALLCSSRNPVVWFTIESHLTRSWSFAALCALKLTLVFT